MNDQNNPRDAESDYADRIKLTVALLGKNNKASDVMLARQLGRNVLLEELGAIEEPYRALQPYEIDSNQRDNFAVHTREDIVMVYSLAVRANEQLYEIRSLVRILIALLFFLTVLFFISVIWR
ncbi:hypothetical protein [Tabrizicola sp.]|jgi:ABC-type Na+ efflux pump permease subunit|uniref:hypothetical protein n=1 Tax=Tabrizicola sp. TaxID=2005166 RepID=UPI0035AF7BED